MSLLIFRRSLINSNKLSAKLYETAVGVASSMFFLFLDVYEAHIWASEESYDVATPVLTRTKPLLESADGLAVATWVSIIIWAVRVLICEW